MHTPETLAEMAEISSGGSRMRGKKKDGKREWGAGNLIAESEWIQYEISIDSLRLDVTLQWVSSSVVPKTNMTPSTPSG